MYFNIMHTCTCGTIENIKMGLSWELEISLAACLLFSYLRKKIQSKKQEGGVPSTKRKLFSISM